MSESSISGGHFLFSKLNRNLAASLALFVTVGTLMAGLLASPSYAWWFTPISAPRAVTPVHSQGLVITPLTKALIPQFVLEPLSRSVAEQPPTIASDAPSPTIAPVATPKQLPRPAAAVTPAPVTIAQGSMAEQILALVNQHRAAHGLGYLTLNKSLTASAQAYAERMSSERFFSHTAPDGSTFRQRNEAAGYAGWTWMGENIAYGQTSAKMVMDDWMNSAGHRENILSPRAKELGVGYAGSGTKYWVQEFGAR